MGTVEKFGVDGWTGVVVVLVVVFSLATTLVDRRLRCITPANETEERKKIDKSGTFGSIATEILEEKKIL